MKSFRLHTESRGEIVQTIIALLIGIGLFVALRHFQIAQTAWRIVAVLAGAVLVGLLCRNQIGRAYRQRYPNARWIGLLAIGSAIAAFGVITRFVIAGAEEGAFTLSWILPTEACIGAFTASTGGIQTFSSSGSSGYWHIYEEARLQDNSPSHFSESNLGIGIVPSPSSAGRELWA